MCSAEIEHLKNKKIEHFACELQAENRFYTIIFFRHDYNPFFNLTNTYGTPYFWAENDIRLSLELRAILDVHLSGGLLMTP